MRIEIDRSSPTPVADQLAARLRAGIDRGRPAPGERLPPVRALADGLGLAPNTVAKAYRELERAGYLKARGRAGTFVAAKLPARPTDARVMLDRAAAAYVRRARQLRASDTDATDAFDRALGRLRG